MKRVLIGLMIPVMAIGAAAPAGEKSEAQLRWEKLVGKKAIKQPAFAFVEDKPGLARVLLIGDSISIGYTAAVRKQLQGKANVHRIPRNGGSTQTGLKMLDKWLGDGKWNVIHFNWGLHDLKFLKNRKLDLTGKQVTPIDQYKRNLDLLVKRLKKTGAKLIWCSTTPVPEGSAGRRDADAVTYNAAAAAVMKANQVPVNDLYAFAKPKLKDIGRPKNVHFTGKGSDVLGKQVAKAIAAALGKPKDR